MLWQGAGAPGPFMLSMCAPLASRYRVYAPDTPGHGEQLPQLATGLWGAGLPSFQLRAFRVWRCTWHRGRGSR